MTERHFEVQPIALQSAAGADGNGIALSCESLATVSAQISGTLTSIIVYFEGTVDGTNWKAILGFDRATGIKASQATAAGIWAFNVAGLDSFRARLDHTTGSVTVTAKGTSAPITTLVSAS